MDKFGEWKHVNQVSNWGDGGTAEWTVQVFQPGYYYLDLVYNGQDRLVWKTTTDEGIIVQNQQAATEKYAQYPMGILEFKSSGVRRITVSLVDGDPDSTSLKALIIRPIQ